LIESYARVRIADGKSVAVIIDFAETVAPAGDLGTWPWPSWEIAGIRTGTAPPWSIVWTFTVAGMARVAVPEAHRHLFDANGRLPAR